MNNVMQFSTDLPNKQIIIERAFDASLQEVWNAYTQSEILDQWWAPHPFQNKTKWMDFREGGKWHYCMISPENQIHWCILFYLKINHLINFEAKDSFCDEEGNINDSFPSMHWNNLFSRSNGQTLLRVVITANKEEDIQTYIQIGFKEGFEMGLNQLENLFTNK